MHLLTIFYLAGDFFLLFWSVAVFLESQNNIVGYGTIIYTTRFTESWHIGTDWESSFEYLIIWMCCEHTENNMNFKCMP